VAEKRIAESDDGGSVALGIGDTLVVRLPENPTTGFRWQVPKSSDGVLNLESTHFDAPEPSRRGAGGERGWTYKATRSGAMTLQMKLLREWQQEDASAKSFTIEVLVR